MTVDGAGGRDKQLSIRGRMVERAADWIRVRTRISTGSDQSHEDLNIPLHSILYVEEDFSRE